MTALREQEQKRRNFNLLKLKEEITKAEDSIKESTIKRKMIMDTLEKEHNILSEEELDKKIQQLQTKISKEEKKIGLKLNKLEEDYANIGTMEE